MTDQQTPEVAEPQVSNLTIQDLISVSKIIEVTAQRGGFRAEEMQDVGQLYNKLTKFLEETGAVSPQAEEPAK